MVDRAELGQGTIHPNLVEAIDPTLPGVVDVAITRLEEGLDPRDVLNGLVLASYGVGYRQAAEAKKGFDKKGAAGLHLFYAAQQFADEVAETRSRLEEAREQERS